MTQPPLWPEPVPEPEPAPPRRKRGWVPRCEASGCGRRIWSSKALTRRFGLLLGDTCYRRRAREARRAGRRITIRITYTPPGDIPGQTDLLEQ